MSLPPERLDESAYGTIDFAPLFKIYHEKIVVKPGPIWEFVVNGAESFEIE